MNFENIHIGGLIKQRVNELGIPVERICNFMNAGEIEIEQMYEEESLNSGLILRWSKLLEYDFFRIYSQHLILYSPPSGDYTIQKSIVLPLFRKNIYTKEMIEFILDLLKTGTKTTQQVLNDYKIPRSTLHKWQNIIPMKNKKQPDYQRIFTDIIDCKYPDKKEVCSPLLKKEILSTLDILTLNELIFGQETKEVMKFNQRHKVYDKSTIHYILKFQKVNKLSDSHIAIRFKLSRCTIAKWKKENN